MGGACVVATKCTGSGTDGRGAVAGGMSGDKPRPARARLSCSQNWVREGSALVRRSKTCLASSNISSARHISPMVCRMPWSSGDGVAAAMTGTAAGTRAGGWAATGSDTGARGTGADTGAGAGADRTGAASTGGARTGAAAGAGTGTGVGIGTGAKYQGAKIRRLPCKQKTRTTLGNGFGAFS